MTKACWLSTKKRSAAGSSYWAAAKVLWPRTTSTGSEVAPAAKGGDKKGAWLAPAQLAQSGVGSDVFFFFLVSVYKEADLVPDKGATSEKENQALDPGEAAFSSADFWRDWSAEHTEAECARNSSPNVVRYFLRAELPLEIAAAALASLEETLESVCAQFCSFFGG